MAAKSSKKGKPIKRTIIKTDQEEDLDSLTTLPRTSKHLPDWYTENIYIHFYYRKVEESYSKAFKSLFYWHNETGNVYTHLIGALIFISLWIYTHIALTEQIATITYKDHLVLAAFLIGAILCLSFSMTFHLLCSHSTKIAIRLNTLDFVGITFIIVGSCIPITYYAHYCSSYFTQIVYTFLIALVLGLGITMNVSSVFLGPRYRSYRSGIFGLMGCSIVFPLGHKFAQSDLETLVDECAMLYLLAMCIIIVTGTVCYDRRWPECCWPGYFDLVGSSHQIFHVCVVGATLMLYGGIMEMMRIRHYHIQLGDSCII